MRNMIQVLDCTLRDGGYCNNWEFGYENIVKIINKLSLAGIDTIECGFLTNKEKYEINRTKYSDLKQLSFLNPQNKSGKKFVVMVNDGEYDANQLEECRSNALDGIRLAFHKENAERALHQGKIIKEKGYQLFLQPMVSLNYTDEEFIRLIHKANEIQPYAFYIVDSFGKMKQKDLMRLFCLVENNLDKDISIGFHSHNNMQLAYSNAQYLTTIASAHNLIIDVSVYGMGRGAGNLNTELFLEYLNENYGTYYTLSPLLDIIDEILNDFFQRKQWGYSLPNYLSAIHNAHPNYAEYLDNKKTLTVKEMNEIFQLMEAGKRHYFDRGYAETLYLSYMERGSRKNEYNNQFKSILHDKKVLLIAPGKSSEEEKETIIEFVESNEALAISINFKYPHLLEPYVFISNLRRYREMKNINMDRCIITSNIKADKFYIQAEYKELLNDVEAVCDNAGLMAIRFLMIYGVREIYLAGFDGYSHAYQDNYGDDKHAMVMDGQTIKLMNEGMKKVMEDYEKNVNLIFLTHSGNLIRQIK